MLSGKHGRHEACWRAYIALSSPVESAGLVVSIKAMMTAPLLRQSVLLKELRLQQSDLFNQKRASEFGRQLGANYFITGKVYDSAERTSDVRRVQYFVFMQAIDIETGAIKWQNEAELTKALVPLE